MSGPLLASPLSTTLSAMVQDLKRHGGDASVRRRQSLFGLDAEFGGEPLDRRRTAEQGEGEREERVVGRGRSLSGTLGGLWRGIKGKRSQEEGLEVEADTGERAER
jgi:hypothetical protein